MTTLHEPLLSSILNNDIEAALYETGQLLKDGNTSMIETTWIHILSLIGESMKGDGIPEFQRCIMETLRIVNGDDLLVRDAFLLTTRLLLLSNKHPTLHAKQPLPKLRNIVLDMLPEGALLSDEQQSMFKHILPPAGTDELRFVQRILAGLANLWQKKNYDDSRIALEYLTRKRFQPIPKPKLISPNVRDDHDILWVLWGAVLTFFKHEAIQAALDLFMFAYKKQSKSERIGLLWSAPFHAICSYNTTDQWDDTDKQLYEKVESKIEHLWKQVIGDDSSDDNIIQTSMDGEDVWVTYFPRIKHDYIEPLYHFKEEVRHIKIKESKSKP